MYILFKNVRKICQKTIKFNISGLCPFSAKNNFQECGKENKNRK